MKPIEKVSVVGLGTLGTQIAIQAAAYGYAVCGFDPEPSVFAKMQTKVRGAMQMTGKGPTFPIAQWEEHARKVQVYDDLARAIGAADLVIEVAPEELETKRKVLAELDRLAPPPCAPRDQQLLNTHFPNRKRDATSGEVPQHPLLSASGRHEHGRHHGRNSHHSRFTIGSARLRPLRRLRTIAGSEGNPWILLQ